MTNKYFELPEKLQHEILKGAQSQLGFDPKILEKDLWICEVLNELFTLSIPMAFKGGTSLSKGYDLIDRFSEDVDVTIDYRYLLPDIDLKKPLTRSALKKLSADLKDRLEHSIKNTIAPYLIERFKAKFPNKDFKWELSEDGEQLKVFYPTIFDTTSEYLQHNVLLEFGGRNSTEPCESRTIQSFLHLTLQDLVLPVAQVHVLSPLRTFWEKATLIHVECHRGRLQVNPHRLSRHWYDLAKLGKSWVGDHAIQDRKLLEDVVLHKKAFFDASYAHYDDCLNSLFRLVPNPDEIAGLKSDYLKMQDSGMFNQEAIPFEKLIDDITRLETKINGSQSA